MIRDANANNVFLVADSVPVAKAAAPAVPAGGNSKDSEYEQRVRAFIEQTKGDSDYEDKVRKFLEESAKW